MLGGILFGMGAYAVHQWRASRAPAWKPVAILCAGLVVLLSELAKGPDRWGVALAWVFLCCAGGGWHAVRKQRGRPTRMWVLAGALTAAAILLDVAGAGGPGPWWKAAKAELRRWHGMDSLLE